jgi:ubiquinone/menaquinone biosynthesis C-methylase UbiE
MAVNKKYILGSDSDELERLNFQHKVWSREAFSLWELMGLSLGSSVLDMGCGPGFTSFDLATIVGSNGRVVGIDKTEGFIKYAEQQASYRNLDQLSFIHANLNELNLKENQFDAVYSRWVLSWVNDTEEVIKRVAKTIKPGGLFMFQEYLDWSTLAVYPRTKEVDVVISACRESWKQMESEINIGPLIPEMLVSNNFEIVHQTPLPKMGNTQSLVWQWPGTFLNIYSLKLIEYGLLTNDQREAFLPVWAELERNPNAFMCGPLMMEVVGRKK